MMAAVAIGAYPAMEACIAEWVTPLLGATEAPDAALCETYARLFPSYQKARHALEPIWDMMQQRGQSGT
jgi:erythritol kinase